MGEDGLDAEKGGSMRGSRRLCSVVVASVDQRFKGSIHEA